MGQAGSGRSEVVNLGSFLLFLLVEFSLLLSGGVLVLLVLRDQIVHVGLGLSELHLVHALTSVPMEESLTPEHSCRGKDKNGTFMTATSLTHANA